MCMIRGRHESKGPPMNSLCGAYQLFIGLQKYIVECSFIGHESLRLAIFFTFATDYVYLWVFGPIRGQNIHGVYPENDQ